MSNYVMIEDDDGDPPHQVLCPSGDIDAASAGAFRESWADVDEAMHLIVVLNDVPFMDSAGLAALLAGMRRFRDSDAMLVVTTNKLALAKLLRTTAIDSLAPVTETYAEALEVLRSSPE